MSFTPNDVKKLRKKTGCGMMDCKKALQNSDGNIDLAVVFLRERGLASASKKSARAATEGMTFAGVYEKTGVILEVNSETDFVAANSDFKKFVINCAESISKHDPKNLDDLSEIKLLNGISISEELNNKIATMGENIKIRRFEKLDGLVSEYVHLNGKIAVLVKFSGDIALKNNQDFILASKDIAMQVAASNPTYLDQSSVDAATLEKEKNILKEQVLATGKPAIIVDKIVIGRMNKFYKEFCLLDQNFIKDNNISVSEYIKQASKTIGSDIKIEKFVRYERGEGLEKKQDNFAKEVADMIKS
ncbi:MAG: elongation factor Ts [Candidatus Improbicoccus devescovinae]|nr:MAG: elongation factor Ts [Candidatus Improbicoccus devescovinae]